MSPYLNNYTWGENKCLKKKPIIILLKSSRSMQINTEQQKPLFLLHLTFCVSMCFSNISCFFFLTSCCSFRASCVITNGDWIQLFCSTYKSLPLQISIHFSPVSSSKLPLRSFVLSSGQQDCTQSLWVPWMLNTPETERKQLHLQEKENILKRGAKTSEHRVETYFFNWSCWFCTEA